MTAVGEPAIPWDLEKLETPPATRPAPEITSDGLTSVFFQGPPYQGRPTWVFAYYGIPDHPPGTKVPGMVLVHGGHGTAYADWVKLWNARGYAAIAFDHFGTLPIGKKHPWPRNPEGGPDNSGILRLDAPDEDQWVYHAVADTILAHSLLRSFPDVDAARIGLTGISWGGVVTSIVAGIDPRFCFVVPVYGAGFIAEGDTDGTNRIGRDPGQDALRKRWQNHWDASNFLSRAKLPMLWVSGPNDFAYTPKAVARSMRAAGGPAMLSLIPGMAHNQTAGSVPEEIAAFADSIVRDGPPLARITGEGREGSSVWVDYDCVVPVESAVLVHTSDSGNWQDRKWNQAPAVIDPQKRHATAQLPEGTTSYFINLVDQRGFVVSSVPWIPEDAPPGNSPVQ